MRERGDESHRAEDLQQGAGADEGEEASVGRWQVDAGEAEKQHIDQSERPRVAEAHVARLGGVEPVRELLLQGGAGVLQKRGGEGDDDPRFHGWQRIELGNGLWREGILPSLAPTGAVSGQVCEERA